MKVVVWGSGGHGGVVFDALRQQGLHEPVAFLEDGACNPARSCRLALPVLYGRENLARLRSDGVQGMVIAIGDETTRVALARIAVNAGFELCTVVHPSAVVCPEVQLGAGTVVFAGSVLQIGSEIGCNVVINTSASVDHDCNIGDGAQLAPRVVLGGGVTVGDLYFRGNRSDCYQSHRHWEKLCYRCWRCSST